MSRLVFLLLLFSSPLVGQQNTFQLEAPAGTSLGEVIRILENKYQLEFAYPAHLDQQQLQQACHEEHPDLISLLQAVFNAQNIDSRLTANHSVLLRPLPPRQERRFFGTVLDALTGKPIELAVVQSLPGGAGTYTDENGQFSLLSATDTDSLLIRMLGYSEQRIALSDFSTGSSVSLALSSFPLREITVTDPMAGTEKEALRLPDKSAFSREDLLLAVASPGGTDLFRQLQQLPGISTANDRSAALEIRGSSAGQTFTLLDGIPLYHTEHYYGIFSAIQSSWIDELSLYTNNLPIAFDGRTGGMLILEARDSVSTPQLEVNTNTLTGALRLQAPLAPGLDLQLAGRSTWQSVVDAPFFSDATTEDAFRPLAVDALSRRDLLSVQPDFTFQDLHGRLSYRIGGQYLALNFYQSNDQLDNQYQNNFISQNQQVALRSEEAFSQKENWQNRGSSFQYKNKFAHEILFSAEAYYTKYKQNTYLNTSYSQESRRNPMLNKTVEYENRRNNQIEEYGGRMYIEHQSGWLTGVSFTAPKVNYDVVQASQEVIEGSTSSAVGAFFGHYQYKDDDWQLTLGSRLSYFTQDQQLRLAPRAAAQYKLEPNWALKASVGRHLQYVRQLDYEDQFGQSYPVWVLSNKDHIAVGRSWNFMVGSRWQAGRWQLDGELYHRKHNSVMEVAATRIGFQEETPLSNEDNDFRLYTGKGRVWGADILLRYEAEKWNSQLAYTLSKNQESFSRVAQGEWFPAYNDRRHQLSWVNTYRLGAFTLSGSYTYNSGRTYTNIASLEDIREREFLKAEERIEQLPAYHRLDAGIDWNFRLRNTEGSIGLSVFNISNRQNVAYRQYLLAIPIERNQKTRTEILGTETDLLPRTFSITARVQF